MVTIFYLLIIVYLVFLVKFYKCYFPEKLLYKWIILELQQGFPDSKFEECSSQGFLNHGWDLCC